MMRLKMAADRLVGRLVPKATAGACLPPDCYYNSCGAYCCADCTGRYTCR